MDVVLTGAAIAKRLASCNRVTRERAVRAFSSWICHQANDAVSDADLIKIWKGLFYCFWHADKLPVQSELAGRLAALVETLPPPLAFRYFEAFLVTIRREWGGIDFLRLDKFYLLIRKFLRHAFLLLKKKAWDPALVGSMMGILLEKSLLASDNYLANGVKYHVSEAFLDETNDLLPLVVNTLELVIKPFILVLEKTADKVLVNKIKVNIFDRFLENGRKLLNPMKTEDQLELNSEEEKLSKIALLLAFSKMFFDAASASETLQGNRKFLFNLHEGFLKLENDLEKYGVHISAKYLDSGCSQDVTCRMVIESTEQVDVKNEDTEGAPDDKQTKKRKKPKASSDADKKKKNKSGKKNSLDSVTESHVVKTTSEIDDVVSAKNSDGDMMGTHEMIDFDESVISNLQRQFEKAAAEAGILIGSDQSSASPATPVASTGVKKRKRTKAISAGANENGNSANCDSTTGKSVKKVRFSMKSNLVWKPNSPMPPQSLRLPPSATPKGSALKKGVPPGPLKETLPTVKKMKGKASSVKKIRIGVKSPSAIKRLRKLQGLTV
ncbi:ribosomal RNA processing protein 1 homolog B-like [Zingiber officinale]|uniref:ribosomal RNA processing protein 1 homolog B-like n=1 Tax=Zingiber officinale TaxID=94328 RepID=UPI001C4AAAFF|nr:ribosomal RNA processing protein 1 homolog B-like [Zingiber officinale]